MNDHAVIEELRRRLKSSMLPFLADAIEQLSTKPGYNELLADVLDALKRSYPDKPWPNWAANGLLRFNRSVILEELKFRDSGKYSRNLDETDDINEAIYKSQDVMEGYYLVGLLLTYFTWIHHSRILDFYRSEFLARPGAVATGMEWGVGHGLLTWLAARAWPEATFTAGDLSPHSIEFSRRLLSAEGFGDRVHYVQGDVLSDDLVLPRVDRLICSELLEHVSDPAKVTRRVASCLNPQGLAFITAAVNAPQEDHVFLFRSADEVAELIAASGLTIERALPVVHPNSEGRAEPPTVLAVVASLRS